MNMPTITPGQAAPHLEPWVRFDQAYLAYGGLKLRRGRRWDDPRGFDRMPGGLDNLDSIALDTEAGAGLGYALERLQDKSVQGLGPSARQLPVQLTVDLADIRRAVD